MTIYRVNRGTFNGYRAGQQFEARLDPSMERRALDRGTLTVVQDSTPALVPGSYRLADAGEKETADADTSAVESRRRHRA